MCVLAQLAVGGSDPLLRVFDRRVGYSAGPIKARPRPWVSTKH